MVAQHWVLNATEPLKGCYVRTSFMAQWLRICLPMQGTQV